MIEIVTEYFEESPNTVQIVAGALFPYLLPLGILILVVAFVIWLTLNFHNGPLPPKEWMR